MSITESLDAALERAAQSEAKRRAVVALIQGIDTRWWGGDIDEWHPNEKLLSSRASLQGYQKLLHQFKSGHIPKAHAVMVYTDGTFAAVMLGVKTEVEAGEFLKETMDVVRNRSMYAWIKA